MTLTQNTDARIVLVTCASLQEAETIAETIVTDQLAACVNLLGAHSPIRSFYKWEGKLQKDEEHLLLIKTRLTLLEALFAKIKTLHSYSTPEFITVSVAEASAQYLQWLTENTQ